MAAPPSVSVIVPAYRAEATIGACLSSLLGQSGEVAYEIVVVDSSPDGATIAAVESARQAPWDGPGRGSTPGPGTPGLRVLRLPRRAFPGVARNAGAAGARAGVLLFVDADCVADPSLVATAAALVGPAARVVGGAIGLAPTGRASARLRHLLEFKESLPTVPRRATWTLPSACLAFDREVFERAGGFPAVRASEDWLLDWRLWRQGTPMVFDPRLRVLHRTAPGWRALIRYARVLGLWSGRARRDADLPGQLVVRHPVLALFLPFGRLARALAWCARHDRRELAFLAFWWPAYLGVAAVWAAGFRRGLVAREGAGAGDLAID